jgi:hypothetical protein
VVAADADSSWVAAQVAADPIAAPLDAFLTAGCRPVCAEVLFGS